MLTIYGIPNCDSCRKARKWLDGKSVNYRFHDLRVEGLDGEMLDRWLRNSDWQTLLNTRSTTWRGIPESERKNMTSGRARLLMLEQPTLIKRPVAESGTVLLVGFKADEYQMLL